ARTFHQRGVPARPPGFVLRNGAHERVVRTMLPRTVNGTRPRRDHHVARDRSGRAADRRDEINPVAAAEQCGAFRGEVFHDPILRITPRTVGRLEFAIDRQTVVGETHFADAVDEEITFAVLAHHVAGIDAVFEV